MFYLCRAPSDYITSSRKLINREEGIADRFNSCDLGEVPTGKFYNQSNFAKRYTVEL
jgi:hypothetical protein